MAHTKQSRVDERKKYLNSFIPEKINPAIFKLNEVEDASKCLFLNGYVVIDLNSVIGEAERKSAIKECIVDVFMNQGYTEEYSLKLYSKKDGHRLVPTNTEDVEEIYEWFVRPVVTNRDREMLKKCAPRHMTGMGAPCDDTAFNTDWQWDIRLNKEVQEFMQGLMRIRKLPVPDINRLYVKIDNSRKKGTSWIHADESSYGVFQDYAKKDKNIIDEICGKMALSVNPSEMIIVPGSHKSDFREQLALKYAKYEHNPKNRENNIVWFWKCDKHGNCTDPLRIYEDHSRLVEIPAGCILLWEYSLLHGSLKGSVGTAVPIGGYFSWRNPEVDKHDWYEARSGMTERDDRKRAFETRSAPKLWNSGGRIDGFPAAFYRFPYMIDNHMEKIDKKDEWVVNNMLLKNGIKKTHTFKSTGIDKQVLHGWSRRYGAPYRNRDMSIDDKERFMIG